MTRYILQGVTAVASLFVVAGCASAPRDDFRDVASLVQERTGGRVQWNRGSAEDRAAEEGVRAMLADGLTADETMQVALLNNRTLQATYEDLGVAQADLVRAGLLKNPIFNADIRLVEGGGGAMLELSLVQDFLDLLFIPLRKQLAESALEAAKQEVAGAAIDLAGQARAAFYDHQAARQTREMRQAVVEATDASREFARRLHEAGNVTDLDYANERATYEQSKLDLARAEAEVLETRERLNGLMGLWGPDAAAWSAPGRLPELPAEDPPPGDVERRAVAQSLELAAARARLTRAARSLGITRSTALVQELEVGASAEREPDGEWTVGPAFSVPIPLFNQGRAAVAAARSEFRRSRHLYAALAVQVRTEARAARNRVAAARARADYYRKVILPLRREIVEKTQERLNAMLISPFQLLQARQHEIDAGAQYIAALREYWAARTELEQILNGRVVRSERGPSRSSENTMNPSANQGGH
jgi:cobalt-zinc-cadmium efflux system outer membrane protein